MVATEPSLSRIARTCHALSDETRLRVLELLLPGERCVCELQDAVGAAQSRLSFHLKVLRDAGLVNDRRQGRWNFYSVRADALAELTSYLQQRANEAMNASIAGSDRGMARCCD